MQTERKQLLELAPEIETIQLKLLWWAARCGKPEARERAEMIAENLMFDPPPVPILAMQVERLATLLGRKAKM